MIKRKLRIEETLKIKIKDIFVFCNTTPTFINDSIRKIDKTNLSIFEMSHIE
ncbi:MAG: hypothetical protein RR325_01035 [Bacilli bacterium]